MPPRRIVFFGSSSIYGTADSELGGFVNRFRLWYESIDPRYRVYNLGIWGEQTRGLIDRIPPEANLRRPHLIMLYPGFNDCRRVGSSDSPNAVSLPDFRELMLDLISTAQRITETVVITGYPFDEKRTAPYMKTDSYYLLRDAKEYTNQLVAAAKERGARVLNLFTSLRNQDMGSLLASDGLHGNAKCHELLFTILRDYFRDEFELSP